VFASSDRQTPKFLLSNTGATLGSGTPSVTGDVRLTVTQDSDGHYGLSIDGGATVDLGGLTVAEKANVAVTDPDGRVLYVNANGLTGTGTDLIAVPGTFDIFQTLISIRDLLENDASLTESQLNKVLLQTIGWITEVNELVVDAEVSVGSQTAFLDSLKDRLGNIQANAQDESSLLDQADIAQVAIDLSRRQTLYEMSLSVVGKLLSLSLLDYLK
jgi:flagellin-like hook-associated protein FlgL